jgi:hypothetical protein
LHKPSVSRQQPPPALSSRRQLSRRVASELQQQQQRQKQQPFVNNYYDYDFQIMTITNIIIIVMSMRL